MQLVTDRSGTPYRLVTHSGDSVLVERIADGDRQFLPADHVRVATSDRTDSSAVLPEGIPGPRALGLLQYLTQHGDTDVRVLLEATGYCESDLFAVLRVLERGDLVERHRTVESTMWTVTGLGRSRLASLRQC